MSSVNVAADTVTSAGGGEPMASELTWTFQTVPLPALISTYPLDGDFGIQEFYRGVTLFFASPMDIDALEDKITIDPVPYRDFDGIMAIGITVIRWPSHLSRAPITPSRSRRA